MLGVPLFSLPALAERLRTAWRSADPGHVYLLRAEIDSYEFTVFPDGRVMIKGTNDEAVAATLYARTWEISGLKVQSSKWA